MASPLSPAGRSRQQRQPFSAITAPVTVVRQGRDTARFEHARHDALTCTTCHSTSSGHGSLKRSVALDCQGCHHGNTTLGRNCASCHTAAEIGAPRPHEVTFALSVWPAPRTRQQTFAHERHPGLECGTCHTGSRQKTVQRDCASCHADHHTADRDCASCHPPSRDTHTRALHTTGCAASGCHDRERSTAVTPARATCLVCHAEQKAHKPDRECAPCHLSAWTPAAGG
jgi:hypothetical protein